MQLGTRENAIKQHVLIYTEYQKFYQIMFTEDTSKKKNREIIIIY